MHLCISSDERGKHNPKTKKGIRQRIILLQNNRRKMWLRDYQPKGINKLAMHRWFFCNSTTYECFCIRFQSAYGFRICCQWECFLYIPNWLLGDHIAFSWEFLLLNDSANLFANLLVFSLRFRIAYFVDSMLLLPK